MKVATEEFVQTELHKPLLAIITTGHITYLVIDWLIYLFISRLPFLGRFLVFISSSYLYLVPLFLELHNCVPSSVSLQEANSLSFSCRLPLIYLPNSRTVLNRLLCHSRLCPTNVVVEFWYVSGVIALLSLFTIFQWCVFFTYVYVRSAQNT